MSVLESLHKSPMAVAGVVAVLVAMAAIGIWNLSGPATKAIAPPSQLYYSTDDGKSYFAADASNGMGFSKDGAAAVRAAVFRCSGSGQLFVGYLERMSPNTRVVDKGPGAAYAAAQMADTATQVKKPGPASHWVLMASSEGNQIIQVSCPDGRGQAVETNP